MESRTNVENAKRKWNSRQRYMYPPCKTGLKHAAAKMAEARDHHNGLWQKKKSNTKDKRNYFINMYSSWN